MTHQICLAIAIDIELAHHSPFFHRLSSGYPHERALYAGLDRSTSQTWVYFRVLQEGEVGAGDDIVKVADGPERVTVADMDALLYLPGHSRERVERALRIPALSRGWQLSFEAMLRQESSAQMVDGLVSEGRRDVRMHGHSCSERL